MPDQDRQDGIFDWVFY